MAGGGMAAKAAMVADRVRNLRRSIVLIKILSYYSRADSTACGPLQDRTVDVPGPSRKKTIRNSAPAQRRARERKFTFRVPDHSAADRASAHVCGCCMVRRAGVELMRRPASKLRVAGLSVAHLLDDSEGRLQRSIIVDVEAVGKRRERAGLVHNDVAAAGPAFELHGTAEPFGHRHLAGPEHDRHAGHAGDVLPPAIIFGGATGESSLGSLTGRPGAGRRRRRGPQVLRARIDGPISVKGRRLFSRQPDGVLVQALPNDLTFHPTAVDQHLHFLVEIPLPHGVVLRREFPLPAYFEGPALGNLDPVVQAHEVSIAPHLEDCGVLPAGGQDANAVAHFEAARPGLRTGRGWGSGTVAARPRPKRRRRRWNLAAVRVGLRFGWRLRVAFRRE